MVRTDSGRVDYVNEALAEELDYSPSELRGTSFSSLVAEPRLDANSEEFQSLLDDTPLVIETNLLDRRDRYRPFRLVLDSASVNGGEHLMVTARRANGDTEPSTETADASAEAEAFGDLVAFDLDDEILRNIQDEIYVFDPETGGIVDCNRTVPDRLGYSRHDLLEMSIFDVVEEYQTLEQWRDRIEVYRSGNPGPIQGHHVRKTGETYPVEANSTLIQRDNGEYLLTVARDISKQRARAEETERLFNVVNDAITVHDPETNELTDVNRTLVDVLGYGKDEILEKGIAEISAQDEGFTQERVDQYMDWIDDNEGPYEPFEWPMRDVDGNKIWFEVGPNRLNWRGEDRVLTISREITNRKEDEETLQYRESLLKAQQEAAEDGILVVSPDREVLSYNDQFQEIWKIPDEVMREREDSVAIDYVIDQLRNPEEFLRTVEELYDQSDVTRRDEIRKKDGTIIERYTSPVQLEDRYFGRVWFFRDVTEKRRVKERLETSLREKETLLEEVHHRVKNNMQIIISLLKMQMRHHDSSELRQSYRDSIHRLETMALIHEKLYQSDHLASVNFPKYVEELCERLRSSYSRKESTDLRVDVEDLDFDIEDSITCGLIINELVSNAFEHGVSGREAGMVEVECYEADDVVRIRVADNGPGAPSDYSLDEVNSTGMNIVRSLVDYDLEGSIEWRNEDGLLVVVTVPRENVLSD